MSGSMSVREMAALSENGFNLWLEELIFIRDAIKREFEADDSEVRRLPLRDLYDLYRMIGEEAYS